MTAIIRFKTSLRNITSCCIKFIMVAIVKVLYFVLLKNVTLANAISCERCCVHDIPHFDETYGNWSSSWQKYRFRLDFPDQYKSNNVVLILFIIRHPCAVHSVFFPLKQSGRERNMTGLNWMKIKKVTHFIAMRLDEQIHFNGIHFIFSFVCSQDLQLLMNYVHIKEFEWFLNSADSNRENSMMSLL